MPRNIILRLVVYYVGLLVVLGGLFTAFPVLSDYVAAERARQGVRPALELEPRPEDPSLPLSGTGPQQLLEPQTTIPVFLSLVIAPVTALPVVWVYGWTRPRRRYNRTFAHTLLVVPIAITLVVFLVKGSLALAFSLAGIVAAVRFRTTLDEPMDAVYLFLVIGTGLAAGVQLLFVALIATMVFNAIALAVWRMNVGAQPVTVEGWRLVEAGPEMREPVSGAAAQTAGGAAEEPADPYNSRLRLHVTDVEAAQRFAALFLSEHAKKWQVAEVVPEDGGTAAIEIDLRLKKSVDLAAFSREIERGDGHVTRVELTRTKTKKPKDE